jgi:hypothetical protein
VLTTSHAQWTAVLSRGRRHSTWSVLGSVLPDVTAWVVAGAQTLGGTPRDEVLDRTYHQSPFREVHLALHAAWAPLLLISRAPRGSRRRALGAGWLGHLAVDFFTHHADAWPPAWPVSAWRWPAPVSHWQHEHHSRLFGAADAAGLTVALRRRPTPLGWVAFAVGTASLLQQLTTPSRPLGLAADPAGRSRDLAGADPGDARPGADPDRGPPARPGSDAPVV